MEDYNTIFLNNAFTDIIKNSEFFMMNQTSDIFNENKFNHVTFVGKLRIQDLLNQDMKLTKIQK